MKELNYRPNIVAKSLKGKKAEVIGFIMPILEDDISGEFFLSISNGIESVLNDEGYRLVISNSHENLVTEMNQIDMYMSNFEDFIDGLIIAPTSSTDSKNNNINQYSSDFPTVYVDRKPNSKLKFHTVYTNNYSITYRAIENMIKNHRTKIAFVSGPIDISSIEERFRAYKNILLENNLEFNDELVFTGIPSFESGYYLAKEILNNHEVDGIVVVNNTMSMGVFKYLKEKKVNIPNEISFLAYDDFRWMELTEPTITTIRQPAFEMGKAAAKILMDKIKNGNKEIQEVCIESTIINRNSL